MIEFPALQGLYMCYVQECYMILFMIAAPKLYALYLESVTECDMTYITAAFHSAISKSPKFPLWHHFMLELAGGTLPHDPSSPAIYRRGVEAGRTLHTFGC